MKKILSALFMVLMSALALFAFGLDSGENMTFWIIGEDSSFYLYHLDNELNTELILNADYITYEDNTAVYLEDDGFHWTLKALQTGKSTPIQLADGDSLKTRPKGFRIQIEDGYAYIPVGILDESQSILEHYLLECSLDGSECREIYGLHLDIWNNYHIQNGSVYYVEMIESEKDHVMCYDLKTGEATCLVELDVVGFSAFSYLDQDALWRLTKEGNFSDSDGGVTVYATGFSLKDGIVTNLLLNDYRTTDDTNFWVNDGTVYFFRDRRLSEDGKSGIVADLWEINAATGEETCIYMNLPYDNNFPPDVFFGKKGLLLSDVAPVGDSYVPTIKYISYDGIEMVELTVPNMLSKH